MVVGVQRLVVVLPSEEQDKDDESEKEPDVSNEDCANDVANLDSVEELSRVLSPKVTGSSGATRQRQADKVDLVQLAFKVHPSRPGQRLP